MPKGTMFADMKISSLGVQATFNWNASSIDARFFTAGRNLRVVAIQYGIDTAATDGGGASFIVRKVTNGTAITAGTALNTLVDLTTVANTTAAASLSTVAGACVLKKGDALALDFTGTLTAAVGNVTVFMIPVAP